MNKILSVMLLFCIAFTVFSENISFAAGRNSTQRTYTDAEAISVLRRALLNDGEPFIPARNKLDFLPANKCYKTPAGTVYTISGVMNSSLVALYAISQVDLNTNSLRWIELYVNSNPMYGSMSKVNNFNQSWQQNSFITNYCNYLRNDYDYIRGK